MPKSDHVKPLRETETLLEAFLNLSHYKSVFGFNSEQPNILLGDEMDPITKREDLIQRMTILFSSVGVPGLSGHIRDLSYEAGTVTIDFQVDASLANQLGFVVGGIVATMLDACIGVAGAVKSGGLLAMPLAEMKTTFVRPILPGAVVGKGETIRLGKKIVFIEATLLSKDDKLLARASGTASPTPFPDVSL